MPHAYLVPPGEEALYGLSSDFTSQFSTQVLNAKRQAVTDEALGRMSPTVVPPLLSWGSDIKQKAADLLMYELKSWIGLAPAAAAAGDENIILRAQAARDWFDKVGAGGPKPQDLVDSSEDGTGGGGGWDAPLSDPPRGW